MRGALVVVTLVLCFFAFVTAVLALAFGEVMWWLFLPLSLACLIVAVLTAREPIVPFEETPDFMTPVSMTRLDNSIFAVPTRSYKAEADLRRTCSLSLTEIHVVPLAER
jgi:hypothetical protein